MRGGGERFGKTNRDSDELIELVAAVKASESTEGIDKLWNMLRPTRIYVLRKFHRLPSQPLADIERNAFSEAIVAYDPTREDRPSFTSWYRHILSNRILDAIKRNKVGNEPDYLSEDRAQNIADHRTDLPQFIDAESIDDIKGFVLVVMEYVMVAEMRALQGLIRGETTRETAERYKVTGVTVGKGLARLLAFAQLYRDGELTSSPTPSQIANARKKAGEIVRIKKGVAKRKNSRK